MRTTVTLDEDIVAALHTVMRERDFAFEHASLPPDRSATARAAAPARPYQQETFHAKVQRGVDLTKALQLAGDLEKEEFSRKIESRT